MRYRLFWSAAALAAALSIAGCGTPQVVKDLSSEQIEVQVELQEQLSAYFDIMENFVQAQIEATTAQLDTLTRKNIAARREIALKRAGGSITTDAQLVELTRDVEADLQLRDRLKAQLGEHLGKLKAKHAEFKQAYLVVIESQKTLDEYIRLEKVDEKITNKLLGAVGFTSEDLRNKAAELTELGKKTAEIAQRLKALL